MSYISRALNFAIFSKSGNLVLAKLSENKVREKTFSVYPSEFFICAKSFFTPNNLNIRNWLELLCRYLYFEQLGKSGPKTLRREDKTKERGLGLARPRLTPL